MRLLSNPTQAVLTASGAWGEKTMYGRTIEGAIRSTVLIEPSGKVAHHWPNVKAAGHAAAARKRFTALRSV